MKSLPPEGVIHRSGQPGLHQPATGMRSAIQSSVLASWLPGRRRRVAIKQASVGRTSGVCSSWFRITKAGERSGCATLVIL